MSLYLVCQSFISTNGKIYGTVVRTISFIQFITLWALLHIVKVSLVVIALSLIDFELVILA